MIDLKAVVIEDGQEKTLEEVLKEWSCDNKPLVFGDDGFWTEETVVDYLNSIKSIYKLKD